MRILSHIDWWLLTPVIFLTAISLTILYSINPAYFSNQMFGLSISAIAFLLFSQIAYTDFRLFKLPLYLLSLILLIFVFIIGFESRGAVRWMEIFGISLQASEISKPMLSLAFAGFLESRSNRKAGTYLWTMVYLVPVVFLIYLQPDLGNALLFAGAGFITLIIYGMPLIWLVTGLVIFSASSPFLWNMLHDYQRLRILTYLNPARDPAGSSYNLIQAIIAAGSGMFFGKGISGGTQSGLKFLPENHTDFIFASLAEKLGFVGSLVVLVLFIILFSRIVYIFTNGGNNFARIFTACSFLFFILQFFVNIGMNIGLVPVVGVTLPFVSYGGSSLLANFIMLGILSSVSVNSRRNEVLEIR